MNPIPTAPNGPYRVVVADDHPQIRELLTVMLGRDPRFDVVATAADGEEAIEMTCRLAPDLAVIDLHMPGIDGFGVLAHLQVRCPQVTTAVLSAQPRALHGAEALALGAAAYLEKTTAIGRELVDALLATMASRRAVGQTGGT